MRTEVQYKTEGSKEQLTVIGCANVVGQLVPLMVIYEGRYCNHEWQLVFSRHNLQDER